MAPSPTVVATLQSAALAAASNLIAQALVASRQETSLAIDWVPVLQFVVFALISTPPNILWQEFLESTFPARGTATGSKPSPGEGSAEKTQKQKQKQADEAAEGKLDLGNTLAKFALDQTLGAALNTLAFSMFMDGARQMAAAASSSSSSSSLSSSSPFSGAAGSIDWPAAWRAALAAFWPLMTAGWRLWPLVSAVNFALVRTVAARNLVGSLAGLVWGIYVSLAG